MRPTANSMRQAAICLLAFLPILAAAQSTTYVSNLGETPTGSAAVAGDSWIAQTIFSGNNPDGYSLNSIELLMNAASGSPAGFDVSLYSKSGSPNGFAPATDHPGVSLGALSGPDPAAGGLFLYTASDLILAPSTFYFVVVTAATPAATGAYDWSANNGIQNSEGGWSIQDIYYTSANGSSWSPTLRGNVFQLAINATPLPEPGIVGLLALGGLVSGLGRRKARRD